MPQLYKLRLGDGTVLSVDQDGLKTWAEDRRAMAQAAGTQKWLPLREVLAEGEAAARLARALVPPKPRQEATPPPPAPPSPPDELPTFNEPPPPLVLPASVQVLADDPASPGPARSSTTSSPVDPLPAIRMKPLDEEPRPRPVWSHDEPVPRPAWLDDEPVPRPALSAEADEAEGEPYEDEAYRAEIDEYEPPRDRPTGPLVTAFESIGNLFIRGLQLLAALVARLRSRRPAGFDVAALSARGSEWVRTRGSEWLHSLEARVRRPAREEPSTPERELDLPPRRAAPSRQPLPAPAPVSELPVLPFAPVPEQREEVDLYEGEEPSAFLAPVWLWTKRVLVLGGLAVAGVYAFLERDTWLPRAAGLGQTVITEIDRQVVARERAELQRRALAAAAERLPTLAPETIQLIYSRSPAGVAEPPEVFQLAREAADRGQASLTPAEAEELRALERELLDGLRPTERERVREYDRTRARRVVFPFENPHPMELVARGARALPSERLERLRTLSHKAVAAGL